MRLPSTAAVFAAGLGAWSGERPPRISLTGANIALFRWLEHFRPRLVSIAALCANEPMPGLDRYLLANPGYTI